MLRYVLYVCFFFVVSAQISCLCNIFLMPIFLFDGNVCALLVFYKHFSATCTFQSSCSCFVVAFHAFLFIYIHMHIVPFHTSLYTMYFLPIACLSCLLMHTFSFVCLLASFLPSFYMLVRVQVHRCAFHLSHVL